MNILHILFLVFMVNNCSAEITRTTLTTPFTMVVTIVQDALGVSVTVATEEREVFFHVPPLQEEPKRTDIWDIILDENTVFGSILIDPMDLTLTGGVSNAR